jgi:high-affinity nickel-transport protein
MSITLISVLVAVIIGAIETLSIISGQLHLSGGVWDLVNHIDLNAVGFAIIGIFALSWIISSVVYRVKRYDDLEVRQASPSGIAR